MSINSLSVKLTAITVQPLSASVPTDQTVKSNLSTNEQQASKVAQSKIPDTNTNNKASPKAKESPVANTNKPVRVMTHVVESYNPQGKVRIKYMDSQNNVIYQIPTEMVAKTQDLMTNTQAATNIKG